jgi:hypothetical protein
MPSCLRQQGEVHDMRKTSAKKKETSTTNGKYSNFNNGNVSSNRTEWICLPLVEGPMKAVAGRIFLAAQQQAC